MLLKIILHSEGSANTMVLWVFNFSSGGYEIRKIKHQKLNLENSGAGEVSIFDFQSQFFMSKNIRIFLIFFY